MMNTLKKYKKIIISGLGIFAALYVCYWIGQNITLPARLEKEGLLSHDNHVPEYSFLQNAEEVFYINQEARDDVPNGQSTGFITLDDGMKVFFMIPGTGLGSDIVMNKDMKELSFACGYHPLIEDGIADGAILNVEVTSKEDKSVLIEQEVEIAAGEREQIVEIDLSDVKEDEIRIQITCDAGNNNDESGDWIIVKYLVVE